MSISKKELLSHVISFWPIEKLLLLFNNSDSKKIPILAYHRVYDIDNEDLFNHDLGLISASCDQFEWQVKYLKKYYTPITFHELDEIKKSKTKLPKNPVIITFDDGFIDNYINAYRILKENSMNAVFYVSTDYIGSSRLYWFDNIVHQIKCTEKNEITLNTINKVLNVSTEKDKNLSIDTVLGQAKIISDSERVKLVDELSIECAVNCRDNKSDHYPMSWSQVREISDNGCEIGSHSETHPILSKVSAVQLDAEIKGSKESIESYIDKPVISIAYPVGGKSAFNSDVINNVKQSGYKYGCSYVAGNNNLDNLDVLKLKRAHVERYTSNACFKAMLLLPSIFG